MSFEIYTFQIEVYNIFKVSFNSVITCVMNVLYLLIQIGIFVTSTRNGQMYHHLDNCLLYLNYNACLCFYRLSG